MNSIDKELEAIQNTPIVFILGIGRSGTTLLQQSLDAHPNIIAPPESDFILYLAPKFNQLKHWTEKDILQFADGLFIQPAMSRYWRLSREDLIQKLLSVRYAANYSLICKTVFYQSQKQKDKVMLISNKFPFYSVLAKRLLAIFPEAKFIHIVRDPRDNVNSRIKKMLRRNAYMNAWQWLAFNRSIENFKKKKPEIFFTLKYEEMVQEPLKTFSLLCDFLNIPYNDSMLTRNFNTTLESYEGTKFYDRLKRVHGTLAEPINPHNIGKWKKEMSADNVAITESITAKFANEHYGYGSEATRDHKRMVNPFKLFMNMIYLRSWILYIKLRYSSYAYNSFYKRRKYGKAK